MRRYTVTIDDREFVVDVDDLAADRFAVRVGEQDYEVKLAGDEDRSRASITPQVGPPAAASAAAAVGTPAPVPRAAPARSATAGGNVDTLRAPMPGLILEVSVKPGATVERGQALAVLDAMKMQNAIRSPRAGRIAQVFVAGGQSVAHGEPLLAFEPGA
ncbi:MAG: biotin/lipoyl-containing protein [Betaproteobacteria bacterium]